MATKDILFARLPALACLLAFASPVSRGSELPAQKTLFVFGQTIAYYEMGTGPTVVLLHGFATSAAGDWDACMGRLAEHHHVVAPDQLGFGASDKPMIDYGVQTWVDMLGEFIRLKKLSGFTLVGESLGGWIAAQYALQAADPSSQADPAFALVAPAKLILVDAAGHRALAQQMVSEGGATSLVGTQHLLSAIFFDPRRSSAEAVRLKFTQILGKGDGWTIHSFTTNRAIVSEAVDDKLPSIRIPTLVVWGGEDRIIPLEDGRDFARRIAGATLVVVARSGHGPAIERPDDFLAAATAFMDKPSP